MTAIDQSTTPVADGVILSEGAASKVKALLDGEGRDDLALRIAVQPGGCSGLRYQLFFDERTLDGDIVADFSGVNVVTDRMSAPYLMGATIDFVDTIEKQGFTIDNPNATGSCACGDSFHLIDRVPPDPPAASQPPDVEAPPPADGRGSFVVPLMIGACRVPLRRDPGQNHRCVRYRSKQLERHGCAGRPTASALSGLLRYGFPRGLAPPATLVLER
jgi:iron-sulfur cluster assembly accessory protein